MIVSNLTYTRRFNVAQYEHEEVTVSVMPEDDQSADDLLAKTREFVEGRRPKVNGAYVEGGKPPSNGERPDPTQKNSANSSASTPARSSGKTNGSAANGKKKGRGRPPKAVSDARKAVRYALDSENMEDLLYRFNDARDLAGSLDVDEWEQANRDLAGVYRELNGPTEDEGVVNELIAAFKAEKTSIDAKRES